MERDNQGRDEKVFSFIFTHAYNRKTKNPTFTIIGVLLLLLLLLLLSLSLLLSLLFPKTN